MDVFQSYANYYDLLYKDKDYEAEVDYVAGLIDRYAPKSKSILELGCGTGKHAALLAQHGYKVRGIDDSEIMLSQALARLEALPDDVKQNLNFTKGDVRRYQTKEQYDVVISLFHVMSYQITNEDITLTLKTASNHLKKEGVFIFDFWYGPAVLTDLPMIRIKRMEDDLVKIVRIAEPEMLENKNRVNVNYQINIRDKIEGTEDEFKEEHNMRYLFMPEIEEYLGCTDMNLINSEEWLSKANPSLDTWSVCVVARKR